MKKLLIGFVLAGLVVVFAVNARDQLLEQSAVPPDAVANAPGAAGSAPSGRVPEVTAVSPESGPDADAAPAGAGGAASEGPRSGVEERGAGTPATTPAAQSGTPAGGGSTGREGGAAAERGETPDAQAPDAEGVLRRAAAAYADVRSLRAEFVQQAENPLIKSTIISRGTLLQRRPDRFLMRFREPEGDIVVSDGRYFWVYYPSVDADQVIRLPADRAGAGGMDLHAQFLGDPLARFTPELDGRDEVQGRAAWVLTLTPRQPLGYRRLKVWVDARDHLVRRFELTEDNGSQRRFEFSELRINPSLGDDLFDFTPPPGVRIVDRG